MDAVSLPLPPERPETALVHPEKAGKAFQEIHVPFRVNSHCRMRKKAVQQGRIEVRDAKKNERHVCGRARVGERPVSQGRIVLLRYGEPLSDARTPLADFFRILLVLSCTN